VDLLGPCIEECYTCAEACILSAHVMMGESGAPDPDSCIGLTLACADICAATGALAGRQTGGHRKVLKLLVEDCAVACDLCAAELESFVPNREQIRRCAELCRRCAATCRQVMPGLD